MHHHSFSELEKSLLPYVFYKKDILRIFTVALCIQGHILIEDLPGIGKTTFSKAFSALVGRNFSRIQGTSDLLPSDIVGGEVINLKTKEISLKKGPIFSQLVLIDEINRMHPKTQSAFLEAMEEKTVTIGGESFSLPLEHMIIATQNPIEQEGTNPLPEAQRDRFSCKVSLGFPPNKVQQEILQNDHQNIEDTIANTIPVIDSEEIKKAQKIVKNIFLSDSIAKQLVIFAEWTRTDPMFRYGISPRGLLIFARAMRANAFLEGRDFVIPEDGLLLLIPFLIHRIETQEQMPTAVLQEILEKEYSKYLK